MPKMATKTIGLKEFRSSIATIWKEARKNNVRYIVFNHSQPIFEVSPISKETPLEALALDIRESRAQAKAGKVYSEKEVYDALGL